MEPPDGYGARGPRSDDLEAVAGVLAADGGTTLDAGFLLQQWSHPGFDLERDAWVVTDPGDGAIVAYGQVDAEEPSIVGSWGVVHPGHRGRGIGTALLDAIEGRATELLSSATSPRFRHAVAAEDQAAAAMLVARGLHPVRHFWHMEIDPTAAGRSARVPDGIAIRRVDAPAELRIVHGILDEAFVDDWGYHPQPFERWAAEQRAGAGSDVALWALALEGTDAVGALTASVVEERGWIDELGVRPAWRGRGIAAALLARAFSTFAERGIGRVILNVDAENATGATRLYERVGMRIAARWDLWERSLGDAT